ncbi:MAG: molybdopterin-dependent oxidoreductase [Actinobacteria bacterium]|nr:molybdopterin-dependent oxidoreductase [Actinomycetota bacterium]
MNDLAENQVPVSAAEFRAMKREMERDPAPLPVENGRPRVHRLVEDLPPVHLELEPPVRETWTLSIGGLAERPIELTLDELRELGVVPYQSDFHCVWGWSRPRVTWAGVPAGRVLDAVLPSPAATHVRFGATDSPYASCVPIEQARDGLFALELDGEPLSPISGGPLRWLQPHYLWGYKGVKWVGSVELTDRLNAGPWETKVGDVDGEVPQGIVDRFAELNELAKDEADR